MNSLELAHPAQDALAQPARAAQWFAQRRLPVPPATAQAAARLRALREALRAVLLANNGLGKPAEAWAELARCARDAPVRLAFDPGSGPGLEPAGSGEGAALGALAALIYASAAAGRFTRLKACRTERCHAAFYDGSKNGSGTWCSMARCGNRAKAARRRARSATYFPSLA